MGTGGPGARRRRPPERLGEGGRRLRSAGSAVFVSFAALLLGALLNAPGLHKSAHIQPEGWKRELALAVTGPLERVSSALLLDRPRRALKAAAGRTGDDALERRVAVPAAPRPRPSPPARTARRESFSPQRPLRLWVAGDSLVVVPGESLLRATAGDRAIEPVGPVEGRIASGLGRPDVFDWFGHVRRTMRRERPRAVVVLFGGNDDHGFMTGLPEGVRVTSFASSAWRREYRRRVAAIMDTVARAGGYLVWIGLPVTRDPRQTARYDVINAIVQSEAARRVGRVSYLDTYFLFAGDDGGYAQYVTDDAGRLVKMRAEDGVHFERPAGDLIAQEVLRRLQRRFDLASWRRD
ncbi:MAG TPA: DUF459 domain-containing protein [Thermodesulfobacteriota bacterium]|nr:DUF459 domain-containing protein [Thermodesulfobacteriota bacterium]